MSKDFINRDAIWIIIEDVSNGELEYTQAITNLFQLLRSAHGQIGVDGSFARFTPNQNSYLVYLGRTSSIIKMSEGVTTFVNPIVEKEFEMLCEFRVVGNLVRRINLALKSARPIERTVYLSKMLNLESVTNLKSKYNLHNNRLYETITKCNQLIKNEFNLVLRQKELEMKREIRQVRARAKGVSSK